LRDHHILKDGDGSSNMLPWLVAGQDTLKTGRDFTC
jgi:hypothetical protein